MTGRPEWAFEILGDLASYPRWWPQIRRVEMLDDTRADVTIRSFLPYSLTVRLQRTLLDPESGTLEVEMRGDLEGTTRWEITPDGPSGAIVRFEERARLARDVLRAVEPIGRPLFISNHAWMMRSCRRGLEASLAGYGLALEGPSGPSSGRWGER